MVLLQVQESINRLVVQTKKRPVAIQINCRAVDSSGLQVHFSGQSTH